MVPFWILKADIPWVNLFECDLLSIVATRPAGHSEFLKTPRFEKLFLTVVVLSNGMDIVNIVLAKLLLC